MSRALPIALCLLALTAIACGDADAEVDVEVDTEVGVDSREVTDSEPPDAPEADAGPGDTLDGEIGDAPEADTGPGESIERLDWSVDRGPALDTIEVPLGERRLIAAHAAGLVGMSDCQPDIGCDFTWFDLDGEISGAREDRVAIYGTALDPSARWLHVFAADAFESCGSGPSRPTVVSGTLELIELATGEVAYAEAMRSNVFLDPAFSTQGRWFHAMTVPDGQCDYEGERWRATAAPHALATFSDPAFWLAVELADGRWAGWSGGRFGIADPHVAGSFLALGERIDDFLIGGGWLHGLDGYGDVTEIIEAVAPDGARWSLAVPAGSDYRGQAAWGPAVLACTSMGAERGVRECGVFDVTGARPRRDLELRARSVRPAVFVGGGAALVFESLEGEARALERIDLASGARARIASGDGVLYPIGEGEAALWQADDGVWLVDEEDAALLVTGTIAQVLVAPEVPGAPPGALGVRQRAIASIVSVGEGDRYRYSLFDARTRRLATLSERLHFAPRPGLPLAADDCGTPWVARSAGGVGDGLGQDARWAFFAEEPEVGDERTLWVVPIDLSAPPRRLITTPPERCHAPMASPDGRLIAIAVDDEAAPTRRAHVARP